MKKKVKTQSMTSDWSAAHIGETVGEHCFQTELVEEVELADGR